MNKFIALSAACALFAAVGTVHAADAAAGKAKSASCAACHGADGNSMVPMYPKLAGQHATYLEKAIKDYKTGARNDATMKAMVGALSDADIANLAAYFASQKAK